MIKNFFSFIKKRKILSLIIFVIVGGIVYINVRGNEVVETRYVVAAVEKGTLITSVSGSGQISVTNQVDIKAKASGDVLSMNLKNGQEVKAGALIASFDAREALKAVRDAQVNLESARLSLQKLQQPPEYLTVLQAENALSQAQESKQKARDDLAKAYEDSFNTVADAFLDIPDVMTGLHEMLFSVGEGFNQWSVDYYADAVKKYDENIVRYKNDTSSAYQKARDSYNTTVSEYKKTSRFSSTSTIENLVAQTYDTTKDVAEAVKSATNFIQFYKDRLVENHLTPVASAETAITNLNSFTGIMNGHLLSLLSAKRTIQTSGEAIVNAERTIQEKTESLVSLKEGVDPLDIESQQLSLKQRQNALLDAQEKLADYYVRAPFDGVITKLVVKRGDSISSGALIGTLVTKQHTAEISLNEVDAAKIKVGQKATITFDAIEDLTITGTVAEIDALGTVTQGVVTYNVKIIFDAQDDRVKPGMSVSASIITSITPDVLLVPNSAIKTQGATKYVEVFDAEVPGSETPMGGVSLVPPRQVMVQIGVSNDISTQVVSGVIEGDRVVIRTIAGATVAGAAQQAPSIFGATGVRGSGGGNALRVR